MDIKERSALRVSGADLRPMAKEIVTKEIDKGTNTKVFNILRGAGRKVKVLKDRDAANKQSLRVQIEDLRKWFGKGKKGDWVRVGTDGEIKGDCARDEGEGKPKCMPRSKAHSMKKKDRASSARRKRAADPDVDRPGTGNKPIMVKTDKKESVVHEDVNVKSIDKFKAAEKDFSKNKDINFQSIADALSRIVTAVRMLDKSTSGRTDVKYEKVISKESTRINNIVNKLNYGKGGVTPEGKEIVKLLNKHGLNRPFRSIIFEGVAMKTLADMRELLDENKLKDGDKVKTPQGTVEIKARDTSAMRGKQDKFTMVLHMKNGKKASMGSHPAPTSSAVTNIAKRFDKGVPSYMAGLSTESVELDEAIDFFKVSKELSDYAKKNGGPDKREFEKAAAYVREIGKNSAVSVQDKAGKGLNMLFKNADTDVRDRMQMILTKGGFKVKGGYVMREGKWFVRQSAKPNKTGTYQGKKYDDGKKAIAQARKDWKLTPDEHMSAKMMKEAIEEGLNPKQIALLKKNYASIDRVDPNGPAYKKAKGMISGLSKDMQMDLAKAKVKFLSQIAADELRKQHGVKLKAKDYMESVEYVDLEEKNVPTNPKLWAKFKSQAKAKFDVYPSAYANGWASKQYKAAGGGWKSVKEDLEEKAVSKAQQKFFGMVRAKQKGEMDDASPEVKKAADSMSKKDVKDMAKTKHKGLPDKKVDEDAKKLATKDKKQYRAKSFKDFREDPCWDTHKQVGTKMKGGKQVPNCVPK